MVDARWLLVAYSFAAHLPAADLHSHLLKYGALCSGHSDEACWCHGLVLHGFSAAVALREIPRVPGNFLLACGAGEEHGRHSDPVVAAFGHVLLNVHLVAAAVAETAVLMCSGHVEVMCPPCSVGEEGTGASCVRQSWDPGTGAASVYGLSQTCGGMRRPFPSHWEKISWPWRDLSVLC